MIIAGDFAQLPPVRAKPLYSHLNEHATNEQIHGKELYQQFQDVVVLEINKRQEDSNNSFRKGTFFINLF